MHKKYFFLFSIIIIIGSCTNYRYLSRDKALPDKVIKTYEKKYTPYKLQPYDYLYISIKSTNEDVNLLYSRISSSNSSRNGNNSSNFFLTGYLVNDSGYIFLPTMGNLYVKGLTMDQTRNLIEKEVRKILKDAVVNVRLTSFNVTFLGEVSRQGKIPFYKEKVNILEAIGEAGGVSYYGDKKRVKVIRPTDTLMKVFEIDLSNANIIKHKDFYVYPNDIIYVPPRKQKEILDFLREYSSFITILTSTITTTLLIIQLTKNNGQ